MAGWIDRLVMFRTDLIRETQIGDFITLFETTHKETPIILKTRGAGDTKYFKLTPHEAKQLSDVLLSFLNKEIKK